MKIENIQILLSGTKIQKSSKADPAAFEQLLVQALDGGVPHYNHLGEAEINSMNQDSTEENSSLMENVHSMISSLPLPDEQHSSSTVQGVQIDMQALKSDEEVVHESEKTLGEMESPLEDEQKSADCQEHILYNPFYIGLQNALPYDNNVIIPSEVDTAAIENGQEYFPITREIKIEAPFEQNNSSIDSIKAGNEEKLLIHEQQEGSNEKITYVEDIEARMQIISGSKDNVKDPDKLIYIADLEQNMNLTQVETPITLNTHKIKETLEVNNEGAVKISSGTKEQFRDTINWNHNNHVDNIKAGNEDRLLIHEQQDNTNTKVAYVEDIEARTQITSDSKDDVKGVDKLIPTANLGQRMNLTQVENPILSETPITLDTHKIKETLEVNNEDSVKIDSNEINTDFQDNWATDSALETRGVTGSGIVDPFMKELKMASNEFMMDSLEGEYSNENLQKVSDSIIQSMDTVSDGDTSVMKVKLYPEELGTVNLILHLEEGKIMAKILVDNESVKYLFQNKLSELHDNLNRQNVQLHEVHIDLNHQESGSSQGGATPHQNKNHYPRKKYNLTVDSVSSELSYGESKSSGSRQISILA